MNKKVSVIFMTLAILFNVCLIAANLLETKLIQIGPILTTGGLLIFPVSYIINDLIAEVWGYRKARLIIWTGFAMNFFVLVLFQLAIHLPAAPFWDGEVHFAYIFNAAPRIAIASFIAFLVGSFLNAYVMSKMKLRSGGRNFSFRAVVSTLVGESADSLVFFPIAFYGIVPTSELFLMIAIQAAMKTGYEIIVLPLTNVIVRKIKRIEQTDVYDEGISYNVFKVKNL